MVGAQKLNETIVSLLREVTQLAGVLFVVEKGPQAVVESWVSPGNMNVTVQGDWLAVESEPWHCHLDLAAVEEIRFVEEPDVHDLKRQAFSIRLLGRNGDPLLMIFFGKMYDDSGALVSEKVACFRALREQYGLSVKKSEI